MKPFHLLAILATLTAPAALAQERTPAPEGGPRVLRLADLVLDQYPVRYVDASDLYHLASQLVGRPYFIQENAGAPALGSLRQLGDTIVIYDTAEQVQRARDLLARLDVPPAGERSASTSLEYRPRFVSLQAAESAVENLVSGTPLPERGVIVLHGSSVNLEAALALLKRIDVPEKQVLLTCQLIEVGGTPQGPPLARELSENLAKLLPESQFTQTGFALLKTSVAVQTTVSIRIDSEDEERIYRLSFSPVAFDEASASLTIAECSLFEETDGDVRELFRTNTVLRGGEYTVLAATGATPKLLVVRVTPQG